MTNAKKNQLTQEYVASKLGVSRPTYIQLERDTRNLTVRDASKLAKLFGMTLTEFLHEQEPEYSIEITQRKKAETTKTNIRISMPQSRLDKFQQVLLYILRKVGGKPNIGMTALYKLLYFIDLDYYEKYEEQLMGLVYIKNHHGPTPIVFEKICDEMVKHNQIEVVTSKFYQYEQKKILVNPAIKPNLSILNGQEKEHIDWELARLSDLNAKTLSDFSHKDVPWLTAEHGKPIDYEAVFYRTEETSVRDYNNEQAGRIS